MDRSPHTLGNLFAQLGLPDGESEIWDFIGRHRPIPAAIALADSPLWRPAQAEFLREAIERDSDWSEVVDELDALLR